MHINEESLSILNRWAILGGRNLPNGTVLLGHIPHVGEHAYLHELHAGLLPEVIEKMAREFEITFPAEYLSFLSNYNGLNLFQGALSIYGYRTSYDRTDFNARQPFSFEEKNIYSRPIDSDKFDFFIGSYNWDGSSVYINPNQSGVFRRARNSSKILNKWESISDLINSEIKRISAHFNEKGVEIDPSWPTIPEPDV
jgi:hypothetical protein